MKLIRKLHFYLGTFFAPTIIFFCLSGMLQMCGLHEGRDASTLVARLAQIHKSQTMDLPRRRPPPPAAAARVDAPPPPSPEGPSQSVPLKIFFLLMAISLIGSSCAGVYMAVQYKRDRRVIAGLLIAGILLPILFLFT
jgi:hypothetical protein